MLQTFSQFCYLSVLKAYNLFFWFFIFLFTQGSRNFFSGPATKRRRGGVRALPLRKRTFFKALKKFKKNVAIKLKGVKATKKNIFLRLPLLYQLLGSLGGASYKSSDRTLHEKTVLNILIKGSRKKGPPLMARLLRPNASINDLHPVPCPLVTSRYMTHTCSALYFS